MEFYLFWLLIAVYCDAALFKKRNRELFKETFRFSGWKTALNVLLILVVLVFSENKPEDVSYLILLLCLPVYLLKRSYYINKVGTGLKPVPTLVMLSDALGVIIIWIYGVIVFGLFTLGIMSVSGNIISEMGNLLLSAIFSSCLVMVLVYRAAKHFSDRGFLTNVGLRIGERSKIKTILVPIILGLFFAMFSAYHGLNRPVQPETPLNGILETTQSAGLIAIFLFLAIGIAPLIEEIVFRGYFYRVIKEWLGGKMAIYIIGLTFAFLHVGQYWGDWLAIMMVAVLGLTLTVLRAWSGSTVASVIMHYVYNGSVTIFPVIILLITNPAYLEYKANYHDHDAQTKESLLKESIAKQPSLAEAYNDLAWLYAEEEKNLDMALSLVEKALIYAPEHKAFLDTKAEVLEKLGRNDEAKPMRGRDDNISILIENVIPAKAGIQ